MTPYQVDKDGNLTPVPEQRAKDAFNAEGTIDAHLWKIRDDAKKQKKRSRKTAPARHAV